MWEPAGTPSDEVPEILAVGRTPVSTIFVSMSGRHPDGRDADYLRWHTFDCRPEQHRLEPLRASLRLVSTPACRAARAAGEGRYDAVDHVMTYFFSGPDGLPAFLALTEALRAAGRKPFMDGRGDVDGLVVLPQLEQGVYRLDGMAAAPRVKVGADVLPWLPMRGAYLLVERGSAPGTELAEIAGVTGAWWGATFNPDAEFATAASEAAHTPMLDDALQITYCFLDGDPVEAAGRLEPALEKRWADGSVVPLLAAPFHPVVGYELERHLP